MILEGDALAAWLAARAGKLTASRMATAMSFKKNGESTAERSRLLRELLAERVTGHSIRHYVNDAMVWGLEKEGDAIAAYEAETGVFVNACGFYDHPRIDMLGATPDGLVGRDGLVEAKCPTSETFIAWKLANVIPEEHRPQIILQLACTGRIWCDFVAFDPRIRDERYRIMIHRYIPDDVSIAAVEAAAERFNAELDAMFDAFTMAAAA